MRGARSYMLVAARVAWVGALAGAACRGGPADTVWSEEQRWTSAHFTYHARPDDGAVGAEALDYVEANGALVAQGALGLAADGWGPIQYFKYRDPADFMANAPCGQDQDSHAAACTRAFSDGRVEVHSPAAVDPHELVHAYAAVLGHPPDLLAEGLAVALSCRPGIETLPYASAGGARGRAVVGPLGDYVGPDALPESDSSFVDGLFITWLVDNYGMAPLTATYRAVHDDASADATVAGFAAHYPVSLAELWQAMQAAPARRACVPLAPCTALDPVASPLERASPALPVTPTGVLVSSLGTGVHAAPAVRVCDAAAAVDADVIWPGDSIPLWTVIFLPAATSDVLTSGSEMALGWNHGPVPAPDYQATPLPPAAVAASCADATSPIAVDARLVSLQIWPRATPLVAQLALAGAAGSIAVANVNVLGDELPFTVDVCTDCQGGALVGCQTLDTAGPTVSVATTTPWVRATFGASAGKQLLTLSIGTSP